MSNASLSWRRRLRHGLNRIGFDLVRLSSSCSEDAVVSRILCDADPTLVLDVGANEGQYGILLRALGYRGEIISFEPMSVAHAALCGNASGDPRWRVMPAVACGANTSRGILNVAGNSQSSSLQVMLEAHLSAAPSSRYVRTEAVEVAALDALIAKKDLDGKRVLLKIDTQGSENQVIMGADAVLRSVAAIQVEMSLAPLYENQPNPWLLLEELAQRGFRVVDLIPGIRCRKTLRMLQLDAILYR